MTQEDAQLLVHAVIALIQAITMFVTLYNTQKVKRLEQLIIPDEHMTP